MEVFVSRTDAPKKNNLNYYSKLNTFYPTYNDNCTWYCWGRQLELGTTKTELSKNLPTSNAENWFNDTKYGKYSYPRVGDIVCYRAGKRHYSKDGAGHVATVEYVYANGDILISESGTSMKFKTRILKPPYKFYLNVKNKNNYVLEGFIHIKDYITDSWELGKYKFLFDKYVRTSPEVIQSNKMKYNSLNDTMKENCKKDKLGYAKYKAGKTITFVEFKYDIKGNLWGRRKGTNTDTWYCVCDSTGNQVIKV